MADVTFPERRKEMEGRKDYSFSSEEELPENLSIGVITGLRRICLSSISSMIVRKWN